MRIIGRILILLARGPARFHMAAAGAALLVACASDQSGITAQNTGPVGVPNGGLDAGTGGQGAQGGQPDAAFPVPPLSDASAPTYTVVTLDGSGEGFEDGGCGASAVEAKQVVIEEQVVVEERIDEVQPVALYIVLDQSLSMELSGLWTPAREALKAFVNDKSSEGIDVALEYFPTDEFDPAQPAHCAGTGLEAPVVPMGRLPMHAVNVTQELDFRQLPLGIGTPIEAALRGGALYCLDFQQKSPSGEKCVAVLVTDGAPMGCDQDTNNLVEIARTAYADGMGIRTFTVGLSGADFGLLDQIAQGGGAVDCDDTSDRFACDISGGPNLLSSALQKIRSVVTTVKTHVETKTHVKEVPVECEWTIPPAPPGKQFERELVNVQLSAPSLAMPTRLGRVPNAAACAEKGWHYDNPDAPTRLIACPQTCSLLTATAQARVDILLGCATIPLQ